MQIIPAPTTSSKPITTRIFNMIELLFIHGILGKPEYFNFLQSYVPEGFHTTAILLDGHGKGPREFAGSSMEQWRRQVAETIENLLSNGNKVIIVAHSMGCLFAIDAAMRGKADALFLLNPPLSLRISRKLFSTPLKVKMGKINDNWVQAAKDAYSISDDGNLVNYLCWIPRYFELFREIYRIRTIVSGPAVPTRVYLSTHDEMVSPRSHRKFPLRPEINVTMLSSSGHYYYADNDCSIIVSDFYKFLKQVSN